jgi:microcompartment protein CcmL/EutN
MTGELSSIEASVEAAMRIVAAPLLIGTEIIPAPHDDIKKRLLF